MKSNLLIEIQQILAKKDAKKERLPIPNYLFVQQYGREILEEMPQIAELFGQADWFAFDAGLKEKEGKTLSRFQMELNRHAGIGREYTGSVLIEIPRLEEANEEKDFEELLSFIDSEKHRLHCVYTIPGDEYAEKIKKQLENYGFVRAVYAEPYQLEEQVEIFMDTLKSYNFQVDDEAKQCVELFFQEKEWDVSDAVKVRIQNIAKEIVYCSIIKEAEHDNMVHKEDVESVFDSLVKEMAKKRQIGFVIGGAEL